MYALQKAAIKSLHIIQPSTKIVFGSAAINIILSAEDENLNIECTESVNETTSLFECPEETCVSSFVKYGNLLRHLTIGNHRQMSEKITLLDTAKRLFHSRLIAAENKRVISSSSYGTIFQSNNSAQVPKFTVGWPLPVTRPPVRFTVKQKKSSDVSSIWLQFLYDSLV